MSSRGSSSDYEDGPVIRNRNSGSPGSVQLPEPPPAAPELPVGHQPYDDEPEFSPEIRDKFRYLDANITCSDALRQYGLSHVRHPATYDISVNCPFFDVMHITIDVNPGAPYWATVQTQRRSANFMVQSIVSNSQHGSREDCVQSVNSSLTIATAPPTAARVRLTETLTRRPSRLHTRMLMNLETMCDRLHMNL